jgi:2-phosphosulfolactate phosphatase
MKVSLSFESTSSEDTSIMIDALRASTTITAALTRFESVIPAFTPEDAISKSKKYDGILAGEREGRMIEGFDLGNSPEDVLNFDTDKKNLILTTSNGTRILENMNSRHVLIGGFVNGKSCAEAGIKLSEKHLDIVMAGWKGNFTIEDYLAAGEIIKWLDYYNKKRDLGIEFSEYAISSKLASENIKMVNDAVLNGFSALRLIKVGSAKDIDFCLKRNSFSNVGIYENGIITKF